MEESHEMFIWILIAKQSEMRPKMFERRSIEARKGIQK